MPAKIISPISRSLGPIIGRLGVEKVSGKTGPGSKDTFGTPNDDVGAKIDSAATLPNSSQLLVNKEKIADVVTPQTKIESRAKPPRPAVIHKKGGRMRI